MLRLAYLLSVLYCSNGTKDVDPTTDGPQTPEHIEPTPDGTPTPEHIEPTPDDTPAPEHIEPTPVGTPILPDSPTTPDAQCEIQSRLSQVAIYNLYK